ncbi:MAG TPA: hypothetical protein PLY35_08270 [Thermotogota bacterium]|nr:hypothetical protein [Thermotogota bacterium]
MNINKCSVCGSNELEYEDTSTMLCKKCGYYTNENFTLENSESLIKSFPEFIFNLQHYDEDLNLYWLPTIITLKDYSLIPIDNKENPEDFWILVKVNENKEIVETVATGEKTEYSEMINYLSTLLED